MFIYPLNKAIAFQTVEVKNESSVSVNTINVFVLIRQLDCVGDACGGALEHAVGKTAADTGLLC